MFVNNWPLYAYVYIPQKNLIILIRDEEIINMTDKK